MLCLPALAPPDAAAPRSCAAPICAAAAAPSPWADGSAFGAPVAEPGPEVSVPGPANAAAARRLVVSFARAANTGPVQIDTPIREKWPFAFFRLTDAHGAWFVKVRMGDAHARPWGEVAFAKRAADAGFSPPLHPALGPRSPANLLIARWEPGRALTAATAAEPHIRRQVMQLLRRVHAHAEAPAGAAVPQYVGAAWVRLQQMHERGRTAPLRLQPLERLLRATEDALLAEPVVLRSCHRDVLPRNIMAGDGRVYLVDWDWAGWDDPLRDVARYLTRGGLPVDEAELALAEYLGHAPDAQAHRRLLLLMLGTEIDFYGADNRRAEVDHDGVLARARRIVALDRLLAVLMGEAPLLGDDPLGEQGGAHP